MSRALLSVLFLFSQVCLVSAQPYKPVAVSIANGLSQSSVYDMVQDREGYVWIATQDGLNRFDGRSFRIFREEPFDSTSISSNYINALLHDKKGRLWIGTINQGLNLLLPGCNSFLRIRPGKNSGMLPATMITDLHEDQQGNIWIGTGTGLFKVIEKQSEEDKTTLEFSRIVLSVAKNDPLPNKNVNKIAHDKFNNIWVATYNGIFKVNYNNSDQVNWIGQGENQLSDKIIHTVASDQSGRIWAGSNNGIDILDRNGIKIMTLSPGSSTQSGMRDENVISLYPGSQNRMWIGYADKGVQYAIQEDVSGEMNFQDPELNKEVPVMNNGRVLSFLEDRITSGIVWAGFNAGGMIRLVPITKKFHTDHLTDAPFGNSFVVNLLTDSDSNLWIGTNSGLLRLDRKKRRFEGFEPIRLAPSPGIDDNNINGLVQARNGDIIFGSADKIFEIRKTPSGYQTSFIPIPDSIKVNRNLIRTFVQDPSGRILAVLRYSIHVYDNESNSLSDLVAITNSEILNDRGFYFSCAFIDRSGNLWAGSSTGLFLYPAKGNMRFGKPRVFHHHPSDTGSLRNHNILCINEDQSGNVWVGTMNGLAKVVKSNGGITFNNYSNKNGITNNVIYAIIPEKKSDMIWLSTNNGLTRFNRNGYAVAGYDIHDGLQSNEFNSYAAYSSSDGEIYFGGISGYTYFYPSEITPDTSRPVVTVSGLQISDDKFINLSDNQEAKTVELKYRENSFTVNFAGIHYGDPQKVRYAYMLEGFQESWTDAGTNGTVNFSQLPPGTYTFRVKASNGDGYFNEAGDTLIITIKPPFHMTIWFYFLMALLIAGIIYAIFKYRLSMKMQKVKEVEQLRRATAADFHDELGHKLTIISWFAEILKKKIGPDQNELRPHLDRIIDASGNLYHTMKDMLWAMDPDKDSVFDLYQQIREFGQELFDNTGIEFSASEIPVSLKENIISPAHKRHALLIFKEIMHNSLKHAGGTATALDLEQQNGHLCFRFRDNGKGFQLNGQSNGRGMENIKIRAGQIKASIRIQPEQTGTVAELELAIDNLN